MAYRAGAAYVTIAPVFENIQREIEATFTRNGATGAEAFSRAFERDVKEHLRKIDETLPDITPEMDNEDLAADVAAAKEILATLNDIEIGAEVDKDDLARLQRELDAAIHGIGEESARVGIDFDEAKARSEAVALNESIKSAIDNDVEVEVRIKPDGDLARKMNAAIARAHNSIADIEVGVDTTDIDHEILDIKSRLAALSEEIRLGVDASEAMAEAEALHTELQSLQDDAEIDADVKAHTAEASASLNAFFAYWENKKNGVEFSVRANLDPFTAEVYAATNKVYDTLVWVKADTDPAMNEVRAFLSRADQLRAEIELGIKNGSAAHAELELLEADLRELERTHPDIRVRASASTALAQMASVKRMKDEIDGTADVRVNAHTSSAQAALNRLNSSLGGIRYQSALMGASIVTAAAVAGPALGAVAGMASAAAFAISSVVAAAGVIGMVMMPVMKAYQAQQAAQQRVAQGAASGAATQRNAARQIENAQRGVRDAIEGVAEAERQAQRNAEDSARAIADAKQRLADAYEAAAESAERANRRIKDAEEALADARKQAARDAEEAAQRVADAQRNLSEAVAAEARAQRDIVTAREEARKALADLNDEIAKNDLATRDAEISLARAMGRLQNLGTTALDVRKAAAELANAQRAAMLDPTDPMKRIRAEEAKAKYEEVKARLGGSDLERKEAQLAVEQAKARLEELRKKTAELRKERDAAARAGIDGSKQVLAALEREQKARERVADAQRALARAQRDAAEVQERSADRISKAERALNDARRQAAKDYRDSQRQIREAQQGVADAQRNAARQAEDDARRIRKAHEAVADAQRALADAHEKAGGAAGAAGDKADTLIGKLSKGQKALLGLLTSVMDGMSELGRIAADRMAPGILEAARILAPAFEPTKRVVGELAEVIGRLAVVGAKSLMTPEWKGIVDRFARILPEALDKTGRIFGNVIRGIANVLDAFAPTGMTFLDWTLSLSRRFAEWAASPSGRTMVERFGQWVIEKTPKLMTAIGNLVQAVFRIVIALSPMGETIVDNLSDFASWIDKLPEGRIQAVAKGILAIVGAFVALKAAGQVLGVISSIASGLGFLGTIIGGEGGTGGLLALVGGPTGLTSMIGLGGGAAGAEGAGLTLSGVLAGLTGPVGIAIAVIAALVAGMIAAWNTSKFFRDTITSVVRDIGATAKKLWNETLKPTFDAIKKAWDEDIAPLVSSWWNAVGEPIFNVIALAVKGLWLVIKANIELMAFWWRNVLGPVIGWVWNNLISPYLEIWRKTFDAISRAFSSTVDFIKRKWRELGGAFGLIGAILAPLKNTWNFLFGTGPGSLASKMDSFVNGVRTKLQGLRSAFASPVNWVIDWPLNNVLIGGINKVLGVVGLSGVPYLDRLRGYAEGGYVPGPVRDDGVDNMIVPMFGAGGAGIAAIKSGEFIHPVGSVMYYGLEIMEALRRRLIPREMLAGMIGSTRAYARGGRVGTDGIQHYDVGGIVNPINGIWNAINGIIHGIPGTGHTFQNALSQVPYYLMRKMGGWMQGIVDRYNPVNVVKKAGGTITRGFGRLGSLVGLADGGLVPAPRGIPSYAYGGYVPRIKIPGMPSISVPRSVMFGGNDARMEGFASVVDAINASGQRPVHFTVKYDKRNVAYMVADAIRNNNEKGF